MTAHEPVSDAEWPAGGGREQEPQLVVASAGTYHLPFPRFSDWMEDWHAEHPDVRLVVQHGPSRPVSGAENHDILEYAQLLELCRTADVVVLQGGAGGVMDMRSLGIIPIVVPRVPSPAGSAGTAEVVDDHQLVFTAAMADLGLLHRATDPQSLDRLLTAALDGELVVTNEIGGATPGAAAVGRLMEAGVRRRAWTTVLTRLVRTAALVATGLVAGKLNRLRPIGR